MPKKNQIQISGTELPKLIRTAKPFQTVEAGHALVQAAELLDWDFGDLPAFVNRVQHIEFGLAAEVEFAAIVGWLGKCRLIHRLDQEGFSSLKNATEKVPDLFAVFEDRDSQFSCLIEVKTKRSNALKFTQEYLAGLQNYAQLAGHPLLVAWKPPMLGIWLLFDPAIAEERDGKLAVDWDEAHKHNLLGGLAGDFGVSPSQGFTMTIECHRISKKEPHGSGYAADFVVRSVYFSDSAGNDLGHLPEPILAILFTSMEYDEQIFDDRILMNFRSKSDFLYSQHILRTVVGMNKYEDEKIHWKSVANTLDRILSRDDLLSAVQDHVGATVRLLAYVHPSEWPEFIPESNRLKPEPPKTK